MQSRSKPDLGTPSHPPVSPRRPRKAWLHAAGALAACAALASGAGAAVLVQASSSSMAQAGQQPVSSFAGAQNGALAGLNLAAANGSSSAGPLAAGATSAFANTTQQDGGIFTAANASADLATGSLRNRALAGDGAGASVAIANSRFIDTVTFNNTSGHVLELGFSWTTEGTVIDFNETWRGSQNITSSLNLTVNNSHYSSITLKDDDPGTFTGLGGAQFNYGSFGGTGTPYFTFAPMGNNLEHAWTTTHIGQAGGILSATLLVPLGLSAINIDAMLLLDCRSGAECDYSHTAKFGFDALPDGLSWTSESGEFLSAATAPGGNPVSEPGTLALLGLAALAASWAPRRRQRG